jgi:hypothetical protein
MTRTSSSLTAPHIVDEATLPRVQKAPSSDMPPPAAGKPRHLRRLLSTRLGNPTVLQIRDVRTSRVAQYAGVACGEVAWGATAAQAKTFHRFIATRRIAHVEGQREGFDALWQQVCEPTPIQR